MVTSFEYSQGYQDALRDIRAWFSSGFRKDILKVLRINKAMLVNMLDVIIKNETCFMRQKEDFNFRVWIPKDKKKKTVMAYAPSDDDLLELSFAIKGVLNKTIWEKIHGTRGKANETARKKNLINEEREFLFRVTGDSYYKLKSGDE